MDDRRLRHRRRRLPARAPRDGRDSDRVRNLCLGDHPDGPAARRLAHLLGHGARQRGRLFRSLADDHERAARPADVLRRADCLAHGAAPAGLARAAHRALTLYSKRARSMKFARVISADSHVMEPPDLWEKALGDRYADYTPRRIDEHLGKKGSFFFTGHQVLKYGRSDYEAQKIGFQEAGWKPEVRVRFQKEAGVDAELMNATYMLLIMQGRQRAVVRAAA